VPNFSQLIDGPVTGFDLETTGVDYEQDRVVTSTVIAEVPGCEPEVFNMLINPGIAIPESASAVHGITTVMATENGQSAPEGIFHIRETLYAHWNPFTPLVGHNIKYDMTLFDRELGRHHGLKLELRGPVLDTMLMDKQVDKYRRGKGTRKLDYLCALYGVELINAHSSEDDVRATIGVLRAMAARYPMLRNTDPATLHKYQVGWHQEQQESLADYFERQVSTLTETSERIDMTRRVEDMRATMHEWPLRSRP
jgi:DNA polymerase-3 subunit epsilon